MALVVFFKIKNVTFLHFGFLHTFSRRMFSATNMGMTNYHIGPHRTASEHIGPHRIWTKHVDLEVTAYIEPIEIHSHLKNVRLLITQTHNQSPCDLTDPWGEALTLTDPRGWHVFFKLALTCTPNSIRPMRRDPGTINWLRSTVVARRSLTGELSLSCDRLADDGWPLMWVNRPL